MTRTAGTLMVAVGLNLVARSTATQEGGAASDLASPAGLTDMLTSKLGISEAQANAAWAPCSGKRRASSRPATTASSRGRSEPVRPVVTEYAGKVAGPDVANILKSAFPA